MSAVTLELAKLHMNITDDADDELIQLYIDAAEEWLGNYMGKPLAGFDPVPADLKRGVLLLASYYDDQREAIAAGVTMKFAPFGVISIADSYREKWFTDGE